MTVRSTPTASLRRLQTPYSLDIESLRHINPFLLFIRCRVDLNNYPSSQVAKPKLLHSCSSPKHLLQTHIMEYQTIIPITLLVFAIYHVLKCPGKFNLGKAPDEKKLIWAGYHKLSNQIIPTICAGENIISNMDNTQKRLPSSHPAHKHAPIAPNRPSNKFHGGGNVLPIMYEEMEYALDRELGNPHGEHHPYLLHTINPNNKHPEWHPLATFPTILRIIALVSGRINIGLPLSRDPTWLTLYTKYPLTMMESVSSLMKYPAILRPLAQHFTPSLRELDSIRNEITALLTPEYEAILSGKSDRNTMVRWLWENCEEHERTITYQSQVQAMMSIGTVLANAAAAAQCVVDLTEHEEMIPLLRGESEGVVGGNGKDEISKQALTSLSMMDSFMKESQRFKPPGAVTFERKVLEPFTLPDGTRLHAGEHIAAPAFHVGWDPEYIENPEVFDGLRFHRLRNQGGLSATTAAGKYHYVSVNETSLHFGYGRNACPGRWFTAIQIKLLLGRLLVRINYAITVDDDYKELLLCLRNRKLEK
ncbi:cytochrome P450 [Aspergillus niger CBS 101883]|uniref:cytochrome P450 n=1 Tax=Aspergillus lacticoffeatus (strain CBS 101883) TaxID=1450533 RepID=UPI000D7EC3C1|nr:cytochrome P450 [Aspergillus niger CBS 101883]PYH62949.1 cytochrome P450 [Aspergillus niger CBS 101883]